MADDCPEFDAFDIIDILGEEMDLMLNPEDVKWKAYFTQRAYDIVKQDPYGYFYVNETDQKEYVRVWENTTVPFTIHMRVAGIDNSLPDEWPYSFGCRREIDDER
ncbi:MAG TPA: hypothetical protein VF681_04820 [Abditibacteriaceae bacterium]|jgi:hypothetical protein